MLYCVVRFQGLRSARASAGHAPQTAIDDGTAAVFLQQPLGSWVYVSMWHGATQRVLWQARYFTLIKSHCETRLANKKAAMRELNGTSVGVQGCSGFFGSRCLQLAGSLNMSLTCLYMPQPQASRKASCSRSS